MIEKNNIPAFGSDNGLVLRRQQTIISTNGGWFTNAYIRHMASIS